MSSLPSRLRPVLVDELAVDAVGLDDVVGDVVEDYQVASAA